MNRFYEVLSSINPCQNIVTITFLEGEYFGEKAILLNNQKLYESKESILPIVLDNLKGNLTNGLTRINGYKVYAETIGNRKKLIICGGGHISIPVIKIGKMLNLHVTVIEDRVQYADLVRRTEADQVICDDFKNALENISGDCDTFFVIVTRGHRYDQVCLEEILKKKNAYVGMIGSKSRVKLVKEQLLEKGFPKELIGRLHSPIGLAIGAETPEEIAVSIMAEIIQVKNQVRRNEGYPEEIMDAIRKADTDGKSKILVTIVSRKGSAPRNVGTKMLIFEDGLTVGTIGGGCAEAEILRKARYQLTQEDRMPKLYTVDMTVRDAEEEGMVCGGSIEVLVERI